MEGSLLYNLADFFTLHIPITLPIPITLYIPITLLILYTLQISIPCIVLTLYIAYSLYLAYFYTYHIPLPSIFLYPAYFYTLHIHIPCIFVYLSYLFTLHISRSWCSRLEAERMPSRELLEVITYNITCKDQYFVGGMQCIYAACTLYTCTV